MRPVRVKQREGLEQTRLGSSMPSLGRGELIAEIEENWRLRKRAIQPMLYVEFHNDGMPSQPKPLVALNEGQKVRG